MIYLPVVGLVAVSYGIYLYLKSDDSSEEERNVDQNYGPIRYSNPNNNHDHLKVKHSSRESARAEVKRMKRNGCHGSNRLVEYYNKEQNGWYVGRERYYDY